MIELHNQNCLDCLPEIFDKYKDKKIIMVSDPPFNIGYHYNTYKDRMKEEEYLKFIHKVFYQGCPFVLIHYPETMYKIALEMGKVPERVVSWVYNSNTGKQHRDIAFFGVKPDFNKVRQPYKNPNDKRIQERIKRGLGGGKLYDWWQINQVKNVSKEKTKHPCQMPIEVMRKIIGILPDDAIILDPFMGSGTTGVACVELNRDFIGIELDTEYFEISKNRIKGEN